MKNQKKGIQNPARKLSSHSDDNHHLEAGKLNDEKFSVFNRKQMRKQKKQEKKQKKIDYNNRSFSVRKNSDSQIIQSNNALSQQQLQNQKQQKKEKNVIDGNINNKEQQKKEQNVKRKVSTEMNNKIGEKSKKKKKLNNDQSELQKMIEKDEEEIRMLEQKMGIGNKNKKKLFDKEMKQDGYDNDLFDFLDNIQTITKTQNKQNYKPYRDLQMEKTLDQGMFYEDYNLEEYQDDSASIVYNDEMPQIEVVGYDPEKDGELIDSEEEEQEEFDDEEEGEEGEEGEEEEDYSDMEVDFGDQNDEEEEIYSDDEEQFNEDSQSEIDVEEQENEQQNSEDKAIEREIQRRIREQEKKNLKQVQSVKQQNSEKLNQNKKKVVEEDAQEEEYAEEDISEQEEEQSQQYEQNEDKIKVMEKMEKEQAQKRQEIYKIINSNINKLSETNIDRILTEIVQVFNENPKTFVAPIISEIFVRQVINPMSVLSHILSTTTSLLVALQDIFGNYVFSILMKALLDKYNEIKKIGIDIGPEDDINENQEFCQKKNLIQVFCHFYIFNSVSIDFIRGIFDDLIKEISESDIELLIVLVNFCGHKIRSDSPAALKHIVSNVKSSIEKYQSTKSEHSKKIDFILINLNDIKMNKKIKNNPIERLQYLINWLKKSVQQKMKLGKNIFSLDFITALSINKDINKWWEPLNNVETMDTIERNQDIFEDIDLNNQEKKKLEQLAIKNKMVSITRKQIFMIIMSAEDYLDASQKIIKLKLNKKQNREIAVVVTQCCTNEKQFNPYYVHLSNKLIEVNKHLKYSFQYSLWDKFKQVDDLNPRKIGNLAKFSSQLCIKGGLNLSVLKVFNLELPSDMVTLFLQIFLKEFYSKTTATALNYAIEKLKENTENVTFVEVLKDYLKINFIKWINRNISEDDENQKNMKNKVNFTIKRLKMLQVEQAEKEREEEYEDEEEE